MWRNLYPELSGKTLTPKLSIGNNVRITKKKKTFDKGYTQRWTGEVLNIYKIQLNNPVIYKTTDYNGEDSFTNQDFKRRSKTYLG